MKGFVKLTLLSTMLFASILFAREKVMIQTDTDAGIVSDTCLEARIPSKSGANRKQNKQLRCPHER